MSSFMLVQTSCWTNSGDASESKTHESQNMPLLCNLSFRNWWHYWPCMCAVEPLVTSRFPLQGVAGAELWWPSVRWFHRRWITLIKSRLDVFFHVCLNQLFNKQYSCQWVEIPWRVCDVIVMCHLSIRHSAWLNIKIITLQIHWKSNRTYQIQKASIRPAG